MPQEYRIVAICTYHYSQSIVAEIALFAIKLEIISKGSSSKSEAH
jgi:hypothetical protein